MSYVVSPVPENMVLVMARSYGQGGRGQVLIARRCAGVAEGDVSPLLHCELLLFHYAAQSLRRLDRFADKIVAPVRT
jgi:hypothetical protein